MKIRKVALVFCLGLAFTSMASGQTQSPAPSQKQKQTPSMNHAAGPFDVKVTPQDDHTGDSAIGRLTIDKQYHGDLDGTGKGQMLTAGSPAKGSAGYVAMEHVTGKLRGQTGSFSLQHSGSMSSGTQELTVVIVPGSGTGELEGISGKMTITIAAGKHSYELEYTLPGKQ
jgi:hypothetical protein